MVRCRPRWCPSTRTVGQLVAETLRLYGSRFFVALPLGLVVAVADQASLRADVAGAIAVLLIAAPFLSAAYAAAAALAVGKRPSARTWVVAIGAGTLVFVPAAFLFPWFAIAAIVVLALFGNAVPAAVIEELGLLAAFRRSLTVARADLVHALGGLATLVLIFGLSRLAMGFLLRQTADNTLRVAIFLADTVLSPDPVPRRRAPLRRSRRAGGNDAGRSARGAGRRARRGKVVSAAPIDCEEEPVPLYLMLTTLDGEGRPDPQLESRRAFAR